MHRLWMTIASTLLTISIDDDTSCHLKKTTSYAISSLFFSYFLTTRHAHARARILLWKVEVSTYYLVTYVEKRPYRSSPRCRSATIRAPSACASSASFRENLRGRAFNSPFTESHRDNNAALLKIITTRIKVDCRISRWSTVNFVQL